MSEDSEYDLKPRESPPSPPNPLIAPNAVTGGPKPGEPGWVEPVPVIEGPDADAFEEIARGDETGGYVPGVGNGRRFVPIEPSEPEVPLDPDVEKNRVAAMLGYVFFMIPLIAAPNSKFARFHANQGLLVFITWFVAFIGVSVLWGLSHFAPMVVGEIAILNFFLGCIFVLLELGLIIGMAAMTIYGIVHTANGEKRELPLIGHWTLIKETHP